MSKSFRQNSLCLLTPHMPDQSRVSSVDRPDFYVAAIGRSGSTMICNWLTHAPGQLVFNEPFFSRPNNSRLLQIDLANFGIPATEEEWQARPETAESRFARLMGPRLAGKRWAFKEVLCEEHERVLKQFRPPKVVISVRNIVDVALSFFEKHRAQRNLERFSDEWVVDYCINEATGILRFEEELAAVGIPSTVVRYEDFTQEERHRASLEDFLDWKGGGDIAANLAHFDRAFEVQRHGTSISASTRARSERLLDQRELSLAAAVGERCTEYQSRFGYDLG
jgi:hypothetical protein